MKTKSKVLNLLLTVALIIGIIGYIPIDSKAAGDKEIVNINLEVASPKEGSGPNWAIGFGANIAEEDKGKYRIFTEVEASYVRNGILWEDLTDNKKLNPDGAQYKLGHKYKVHIFVTYCEGYSFGEFDKIKATINGDVAEKKSAQAGFIEICYTFTCASRGSLYINGLAVPYEGYNPVYEGVDEKHLSYARLADKSSEVPNDSYYKNGIAWGEITSNGDYNYKFVKTSSPLTFNAGSKYFVDFILIPNDGVVFPQEIGSRGSVTLGVEGADKAYVVSDYAVGENKLKIRAEYTAKASIRNIDISGYVPPSAGNKPVYSGLSVDKNAKYEVSRYSKGNCRGGVIWGKTEKGYDTEINPDKQITFESGKTYYTKIKVVAKSGEKFYPKESVIKATLGGYNANISDLDVDNDTLILTVRFDAKDKLSAYKYTVPEPVIGEKPGKAIVETIPEGALKSNDIDAMNVWQVSDDDITYRNMEKDEVFKSGKYYRNGVIGGHLTVIALTLLFDNEVLNKEVCYEIAPDSDIKIYLNGKLLSDKDFDSEGFYKYGKLGDDKEDKLDPKKDDQPGKKDSTSSDPSKIADGKKVDGVGTISKDGKTITDEEGVKYSVAEKMTKNQLKKNLKIADKKSGGKYKITKLTKKGGKVVGGTVEYVAPYNKNCKLISATGKVKLAGVTFTVTSIAPNCAKGCKSLSKVVLGKNIINIGKNAFNGCSKLKTVEINSKKLKKVGANAFKGINKKATIKVPKAKKKAYTKLLSGKGQAKTVKIK